MKARYAEEDSLHKHLRGKPSHCFPPAAAQLDARRQGSPVGSSQVLGPQVLPQTAFPSQEPGVHGAQRPARHVPLKQSRL